MAERGMSLKTFLATRYLETSFALGARIHNLLLNYKHTFKIFKFNKRNTHIAWYSLTVHKRQQKWQYFKHLTFKFIFLRSVRINFSNLACDELYKPDRQAGTNTFALKRRSIAPKTFFTWWVFKPNTPARFQGLQIAQLIKRPSTNP